MRADYSKGILAISFNGENKSDKAKAKAVIKHLEEEIGAYETCVVEDEGTKWESWSLSNDCKLTIREMQEDYKAAKEMTKVEKTPVVETSVVTSDNEVKEPVKIRGRVEKDNSIALISGTKYYCEIYYKNKDKEEAEVIANYMKERQGYTISARNEYKESGLISIQYKRDDELGILSSWKEAKEDFKAALYEIEEQAEEVKENIELFLKDESVRAEERKEITGGWYNFKNKTDCNTIGIDLQLNEGDRVLITNTDNDNSIVRLEFGGNMVSYATFDYVREHLKKIEM